MRLVQQLGGIARGILALGLPTTAAAAIARRLALDSMPATRHAVLGALSTGEVLSTSACARAANLDRKVCRMALEELAAIGVVENDRSDEEDDPTGVVNWCLSGDDGAVIVSVFEAHRASGWGWDETWVYTSTSPQEREEESTGTGGQPTFRPTSAESSDGHSHPPRQDATYSRCQICGTDLFNAVQRERGTCGPCYMNHGADSTAESTA
jgi:hypothetical protein